jgi:hypothetical protein
MVRRPRRGNEDVYQWDYESLEPLRALANKYRIAIVAIHHLNKR